MAQNATAPFRIEFIGNVSLTPLFKELSEASIIYTMDRKDTLLVNKCDINTQWGKWIMVNQFTGSFASSKMMKFTLGLKMFNLVDVDATLHLDQSNMEWYAQCVTGAINMNEVLQMTLNSDDHILLDVIKTGITDKLNCKFWKMDETMEFAIDCHPAIANSCGFNNFLQLVNLKSKQSHKIISLRAERGDLSTHCWKIKIEPNEYYLGFDLGVLELRNIAWELQATNDTLSASNISLKSCSALLHLFKKDIPISGEIEFKIYQHSTILNIHGCTDTNVGTINPWKWIQLKSVNKVFKANKIRTIIRLSSEQNGINTSILCGSTGLFMGEKCIMLFGMEPHRLTPNAFYAHVGSSSMNLSQIIASFGFKCVDDIGCSLRDVRLRIATLNCDYQFAEILEFMNESIRDMHIEFKKGSSIEAVINVMDLFEENVMIQIHTDGIYLDQSINVLQNEYKINNAFKPIQVMIAKDIQSRINQARKVWRRANKEVKRVLDKTGDNIAWWMDKNIKDKVLCRMERKLELKDLNKLLLKVNNDMAVECQKFRFILDAKLKEFSAKLDIDLKCCTKIQINVKYEITQGFSMKDLISAISDKYSKGMNEYQNRLKTDLPQKAIKKVDKMIQKLMTNNGKSVKSPKGKPKNNKKKSDTKDDFKDEFKLPSKKTDQENDIKSKNQNEKNNPNKSSDNTPKQPKSKPQQKSREQKDNNSDNFTSNHTNSTGSTQLGGGGFSGGAMSRNCRGEGGNGYGCGYSKPVDPLEYIIRQISKIYGISIYNYHDNHAKISVTQYVRDVSIGYNLQQQSILTVTLDEFRLLDNIDHLRVGLQAIYNDNNQSFDMKGQIKIFNQFSVPFTGGFISRAGNSMKLNDIMKADIKIPQVIIHEKYLIFKDIQMTVDVNNDEYGLDGRCEIFGCNINGGFRITRQCYQGELSAKEIKLETILRKLDAPEILVKLLSIGGLRDFQCTFTKDRIDTTKQLEFDMKATPYIDGNHCISKVLRWFAIDLNRQPLQLCCKKSASLSNMKWSLQLEAQQDIGFNFFKVVEITSVGFIFEIKVKPEPAVKLGVKLNGKLNFFNLARFDCEGKAEVTFLLKPSGPPKIKIGVAVRSCERDGFNPLEIIGTKLGIPAKYLPNIWTIREMQCSIVIAGARPEIQLGASGSIFGVDVTALIAFTGIVPVAFFFRMKECTLKKIVGSLFKCLDSSALDLIPDIGIEDLLVAMSTRDNFEVDFKEPPNFNNMKIDTKKPDSWNCGWEAGSSSEYVLSYGFEIKGVINLFNLIKMGAHFRISTKGLYFKWELDIAQLKKLLDDIRKKVSNWVRNSRNKANAWLDEKKRAFDNWIADKKAALRARVPWPFKFVVSCVLEIVRMCGGAVYLIAKTVANVVLTLCDAAVTAVTTAFNTFLIFDRVSFELDIGEFTINKIMLSIMISMFGKKIPIHLPLVKNFSASSISEEINSEAESKWDAYVDGVRNQSRSTCNAVVSQCKQYIKAEAAYKAKHGKDADFTKSNTEIAKWMNENKDKEVFDPNFDPAKCPSFDSLQTNVTAANLDLSHRNSRNESGKGQKQQMKDKGDQGDEKGQEPNNTHGAKGSTAPPPPPPPPPPPQDQGAPGQQPQDNTGDNDDDGDDDNDSGEENSNGEEDDSDDDSSDDDTSSECSYTELPMVPINPPENLHKTKIDDAESAEKYERITKRIMNYFEPIDTEKKITKQEVEELVEKYKGDEEKVIKILEEKLKEETDLKQKDQQQKPEQAPMENAETKQEEKDESETKIDLDEMKQKMMSALLAQDEAIVKDPQKKDLLDIIGDIESGQSLFMLTLDCKENDGTAGKAIFDGKDTDFEHKYRFLISLKEAMDKNQQILIQKVISLIEEDQELHIGNMIPDNLYCNYLLLGENGISDEISNILQAMNKDTIKRLKCKQISLLSVNCIKLIQYFANPVNKDKTLQNIIDGLFVSDEIEIRKLNFYQNILDMMKDDQMININDVVNILKRFGGNCGSNALYCVHQKLLFDKDIVALCDTAFEEDNNSLRKEIERSKSFVNININPIISFLSTQDQLKTNIQTMIDGLLNSINEYDVDKLMLFQEIFKQLEHGEMVKASVMCGIFNTCNIKINRQDWKLSDSNNKFFFVYTNLHCDESRSLLNVLQEMRKNRNGDVSINVRLLMQKLLTDDGPINIIPLYNKALSFKETVDIDNKYIFFDEILNKKNGDLIPITSLLSALQKYKKISLLSEAYFFAYLKMEETKNFNDSLFSFYDVDNMECKDNVIKQSSIGYPISQKILFDLVFPPKYDDVRLNKIMQLLFEKARKIMITDNDFMSKAELYKDFIANRIKQTDVLIFKCSKLTEYLSNVEENIAEYVKILFYFHLKTKYSKKDFSDEFSYLLSETSQGIYKINQNNFAIELNELKRLFFRQENKIQNTFNTLFQESREIVQRELREKHFKKLTDNSTNPFLNRVKYWQKKQFCQDIAMKPLIPDICTIIDDYEIIKLKDLSVEKVYCIYLLCKYTRKTNINQVLLSCFQDEPSLIEDIKLAKQTQKIDCDAITDIIWCKPTHTLRTILNSLHDRLDDDDEIKLMLFQNIFQNMKNHLINANAICQSLKLLQSRLQISNEIYENSIYFIYFKMEHEKQPLKQILLDLRTMNQNIYINVELLLRLVIGCEKDNISQLFESIYKGYGEFVRDANFKEKSKLFDDILDSEHKENENVITLHRFQKLISSIENDECFFIYIKMQSYDFHTALFEYYDEIYRNKDNQNHKMIYLLIKDKLIDLLFNVKYDRIDLQNTIGSICAQATNTMQSYDFVNKRDLYNNLLEHTDGSKFMLAASMLENVFQPLLCLDFDHKVQISTEYKMLLFILYLSIECCEIERDDHFESQFVKLLTFDTDIEDYKIDKDNMCLDLKALRKVIFAQHSCTTTIRDTVNKLFNKSQTLTKTFQTYFKQIDNGCDGNFWFRLIYWQKHHFCVQLSQQKLLSMKNVYDYIKFFDIFEENDSFDPYFISLNMQINGCDLTKSLYNLYGLNETKNIDSFMINTQMLITNLKNTEMEQREINSNESLNYNIGWTFSCNRDQSKRQLIQQYDFKNKQQFYKKIFCERGNKIRISRFCNVLNAILDIKISYNNEMITLEATKDYAFFFVYLKMKCLGYRQNDNEINIENKSENDNEIEDMDTRDLLNKAFEDLFKATSDSNIDNNLSIDMEQTYEIDVANYTFNKIQFRKLFFEPNERRNKNIKLCEIIDALYDEAMEVMEELNFDEMLKDRIKMIDVDTVFGGMIITKVITLPENKSKKRKGRKKKGKNKKKMESLSELFDKESDDDFQY